MEKRTVWNGFDDWKDVQDSFSMSEPQPDHVIAAYYDCSGYEGDAYVAYRNGEKYYLVEGGHCSCYGLEEQWSPTEYNSKEELIACLEKGYASRMKDLLKLLNEE